MARASRSMAEYFRSHGSNFRDPKAMGCSSPTSFIWRFYFFFKRLKDCSQVGVHLTLLSILFRINSIRGVAIVEKFGMNLL